MGALSWLFPRRGVRLQAYQRGIMRRYLREGEGWQSHLRQSQSAILRFVHRYRPSGLNVLGSGWLLDFPMEYLLRMGLTLHLYDLAHPPQVVARYADEPLVQFHTLDVTGGLLALLRELPSSRSALQTLGEQMQQLRVPTDELCTQHPVVSLNLLSQLPYPLLEMWDSAPQLPGMIETLQLAHLALLRAFPAALLISDVEELHYPKGSGAVQSVVPTVVADIPPLCGERRWTWHFDATGNYLPDMRVELNVVAGVLQR